MKHLLWFVLGIIVAIAGETYAQQQWGQPYGQQQTDALNSLNNNSNYQRQQQDIQRFSNPMKPPC